MVDSYVRQLQTQPAYDHRRQANAIPIQVGNATLTIVWILSQHQFYERDSSQPVRSLDRYGMPESVDQVHR